MTRRETAVVYLTADEKEWLKRKAYWEGVPVSELLRNRVREMIREDGYLRPPDDEPQDFGYEKEIMEMVNGVCGEG